LRTLLTLAVLLVSTLASADPVLPVAGQTFDYLLHDHPDGELTPSHGPYGLRYDSLAPPAGAGPTFSMDTGGASILLRIFASGDAQMTGTLYRNNSGELYSFIYTLTGLDQSTSGENWNWTTGAGALSGHAMVEQLIGKQDGFGFAYSFLSDGARLPGDTTSLVGRGWFEPVGGEGGVNDLLNTASLATVPEPTAMTLFGLGLITFALRIRAWDRKPKRSDA